MMWCSLRLLLGVLLVLVTASSPYAVLDKAFGAGAADRAEMQELAHTQRHEDIPHRRALSGGGMLLEMRRRQRSHEEVLSLANALKIRAAKTPAHAVALAEHASEHEGADDCGHIIFVPGLLASKRGLCHR